VVHTQKNGLHILKASASMYSHSICDSLRFQFQCWASIRDYYNVSRLRNYYQDWRMCVSWVRMFKLYNSLCSIYKFMCSCWFHVILMKQRRKEFITGRYHFAPSMIYISTTKDMDRSWSLYCSYVCMCDSEKEIKNYKE